MTSLNVGLYLRVSTATQTKSESLAEQERAGRTWAAANGHEVGGVFTDPALSGALDALDRPGLLGALDALEAGAIDALAVRDLDRLSRKLTIQEAVLARIWDIDDTTVWEFDYDREVLCDDPDDPMRTFVRQMMGAAKELDRAMIAKRLRDARVAKTRRGGHANGPAPFGWRTEHGYLYPVIGEQAALVAMRTWAGQAYTQTQIAALLNDADHRTREGSPWTQQSVSRVLHRDAARSPARRAYEAGRLAG